MKTGTGKSRRIKYKRDLLLLYSSTRDIHSNVNLDFALDLAKKARTRTHFLISITKYVAGFHALYILPVH